MYLFIQLFSFFFLAVPISLFIHELGHAITSLLLRADYVLIRIGKGTRLFRTNIRRFSVAIYTNFFVHYMTEYERTVPFVKREQIVIALMGPIANSIFGVMSFFIYKEIYTFKVFFFCALFNWWLMISNLIPFKIGQKRSDGYTIYTLLFK